jgi:hypothetical protein
VDKSVAHCPSEVEMTKEIHSIVKILMDQGWLSGDPHDIVIERVGRVPVRPCRRSEKPKVLNLEQLEWAKREKHFWFSGPVKSLKIKLANGTVRKTYMQELDGISFETVVNELNYDDFRETIRRLKSIAGGFGLKIDILPGKRHHETKVEISSEKPMSEPNINEFLQGIEKVLEAI